MPDRRSLSFLFAYLAWVGVLFFFFYLNTNPLSQWINGLQRHELLEVLKLILGDERIRGTDILAHPHFRIFITQACNGLIPFYLYSAGVLAYPYRWRDRILWLLIGYGVISAVNVLRLLFVTAMVARDPANFHWAHDLLGNALLMVTGLGLFYGYLRQGHRD